MLAAKSSGSTSITPDFEGERGDQLAVVEAERRAYPFARVAFGEQREDLVERQAQIVDLVDGEPGLGTERCRDHSNCRGVPGAQRHDHFEVIIVAVVVGWCAIESGTLQRVAEARGMPTRIRRRLFGERAGRVTRPHGHCAMPITVALVNDYEIIVHGLAAMLAPFSDRVAIVEIDVGSANRSATPTWPCSTPSPVDATPSIGPRQMVQEGLVDHVLLYTWDAAPSSWPLPTTPECPGVVAEVADRRVARST